MYCLFIIDFCNAGPAELGGPGGPRPPQYFETIMGYKAIFRSERFRENHDSKDRGFGEENNFTIFQAETDHYWRFLYIFTSNWFIFTIKFIFMRVF